MAKSAGKYARELGSHQTILEALDDSNLNDYRAGDFLRRLKLLLPERDYRQQFFDYLESAKLRQWLLQPPVSNITVETIRALHLLPTSSLVKYIEQREGNDIRDDLEEKIAFISQGGFNPQDELHLELEYSRHIREYKEHERMAFETFRNLPWIENQALILTDYDTEYIKKTAEEAVNVFHIIDEKKKQSQLPLLVVGNIRYGWDFVVYPIKRQLEEIGAYVKREYISSTRWDFMKDYGGIESHLSVEFWSFIDSLHPNVVVVDGTVRSHHEGKTRFPAAMLGYLDAFNEFNQSTDKKYGFTFSAPKLTSSFFVGNEVYGHQIKDYHRELCILSSTSWEGSQGHFDDPENQCSNRVYGFTSRGLEKRPRSTNYSLFVSTIQDIMKQEISKKI